MVTPPVTANRDAFIKIRLNGFAVIEAESDVGEFVYRVQQQKLLPRVSGHKSLGDISLAEIELGVKLVLEGYTGNLKRKELISEVAAAFEFSRKGPAITQRIEIALNEMEHPRDLDIVGTGYVLLT